MNALANVRGGSRCPQGAGDRDRAHKHVPRRGVLAAVVLLLCIISCGAPATSAQTTSENTSATSDDSPTPAGTAHVFQRVHDAVRLGDQTPENGEHQTPSVVTVTLRLNGVRIGYGRAQGTVDPYVGALGEALRSASAWADRSSVDTWRERCSIEVEVGGGWKPRIARSWGELGTHAKPGARGVAMQVGQGADERSGVLMPGRQLRFGYGPIGVWRRAGADLDLPIGDLSSVLQTTGVRCYTFDVLRIAQEESGAPIRFLERTGEPVRLDAVTTPGVRALADDAARFLIAQRWTGEAALGMRGDMVLPTGQYDPDVAPLREQLIAAYALARYARTTDVPAENAALARQASIGVLADALRVEPGETLFSDDPVGAAAFLLCLAELSRSGPLLDTLFDAVAPARRMVVTFFGGPEGQRVEAGVAALVALALVRDHKDLGGPELNRSLGLTAARALLADMGAEGARDAMPWLGWTLIEGAEEDGRVLGDVPLLDFRDGAERLQANTALLDPIDHDLAGGFLWEDAPGAYPDWRSARIGAVLATMLGDERLTSNEECAQRLDRLRRSLRFVMQLTVDRGDLWRTPAGREALGGVRRTLWSNAASVDASAMTLIVACETIDSVEKVFGER